VAENKYVGFVISKLELDEDAGIYEYWVKMPNRKIEVFKVKTANIRVGNKVEVAEVEKDGETKLKIVRIL